MEPNSSSGLTPPKYRQQLAILHGALLAGQAFFCAIAIGLVQTGNAPTATLKIPEYAILLVAALPILGFAIARSVLRGRLLMLQQTEPLEKKLAGYRGALLFSWAVAEAGNLPAIIVYLLTGSIYTLAMAALGLALFFLARPTERKMNEEIGVSGW